MMNEDFSPPLEESLKRKDSDQSWKPPSEGSEDTEENPTPVDPNKLFLVSLATLMALFT